MISETAKLTQNFNDTPSEKEQRKKIQFTTSEIMQKLYNMNRTARRIWIKNFSKVDRTKLLALFERYRKDPTGISFGSKSPDGDVENITPK